MSIIELPQSTPAIVLFGRDNAGKPHASWFDQASAELATKAAGLMNMQAVAVEGDGLRELADTLPRGRIFASGRAFTPFVSRKLYERLVEVTRDLLGLSTDGSTALNENVEGDPVAATGSEASSEVDAEANPESGHDDGGKATPVKRPTAPAEIGISSLVLATTGPEEGWFESEVIGQNGAMLTLKWRDYPGERTFVRRRHQLGFLPAQA